jgi:zinc transporter ZupT
VDIAPVMVAVTAACWVMLMIGAIITHVRYHDGAKYVLATSIYLALAAFVAWGRFGPGSFTA